MGSEEIISSNTFMCMFDMCVCVTYGCVCCYIHTCVYVCVLSITHTLYVPVTDTVHTEKGDYDTLAVC